MKYSLRELLGIVIWWTEGTKSYKYKGTKYFVYPVDVTNTNPEIINAFLNFLRNDIGIEEKRLKLQLQIHAGDDKEKLEKYWSALTKVPRERFQKTIVRPVGNKVGKSMGTCKVRYSDKPTYLRLKKNLEDVLTYSNQTGHGVTANILALGASDSRFESECPEKIQI